MSDTVTSRQSQALIGLSRKEPAALAGNFFVVLLKLPQINRSGTGKGYVLRMSILLIIALLFHVVAPKGAVLFGE